MSEFFRSKFSEDIFNHKYAHEQCETWDKLSETLINDVCGNLLPKEEINELINIHTKMQAIAGGRYLYYAGRKNKFYNNCFAGETKVLTDFGLKDLKSNVGKILMLKSPIDGKHYPSEIIYHGKQDVQEIIFKPLRGNSNISYKIKSTRTHHWPLINGKDTYDLRIGDVVPAGKFSNFSKRGWIHGLIFGDGNLERIRNKDQKYTHKIRLCGEKNMFYLNKIEDYLKELDIEYNIKFPKTYNGDAVIRIWNDINFKELPSKNETTDYISGFILGWIKADACEKAGKKINSVTESHIDYFIDNAICAGLVISGEKRFQDRETAYKKHSRLYTINYNYGERWEGFKVDSIRSLGKEDVYCPYEPIYNRFILENNIDTFNCFLLKAEEDSREEWANVSWRAQSCLMTGGGIGIDYSVYRPRGSKLSKTGGLASGAVSAMKIINEIGREVMQGGSRRSAIFASLNWQHGDIDEFLNAKNWYHQKIANTTVGALKEKDFNFPAPLDMTNISLNYDNDFLEQVYQLPIEEIKKKYLSGEELIIKHIPDTYFRNCQQACETGEPGFSFNFFKKVNEILRNACTEVTSEDDSDVCNLASVNMSRIEDKDTFRKIVRLFIKFLVCGTLRADLPYDKVYQVREKNRRLGLGLMGIHEWLLKRGYRYEMNDKLREWLQIYKEESEKGANELCDKLGISRPVAYRAIAPTGSIAILAGTTSGIEPLYAVAYKRRYLKGAKDWHYQYVVDGTAEILIHQMGIDPKKIESAVDLSKDFERRIKFQADVQDYVDMSISSTINLPKWGTKYNNEDTVKNFSSMLLKYAHRLRGFTCYPDGARGGQPLNTVSYDEAIGAVGKEFKEEFNDVCEITGHGGMCGA